MPREKLGVSEREGVEPRTENDVLLRSRSDSRFEGFFAVCVTANGSGREVIFYDVRNYLVTGSTSFLQFGSKKINFARNIVTYISVFFIGEELSCGEIRKNRREFVLRVINAGVYRNKRGYACFVFLYLFLFRDITLRSM